jgi:hypothetical protein
VKSLDDIPYIVIGMGFAAAGFFLGTLLCYQSLWPLLAGPTFGAVLGCIAAAMVLRKKELPLSATLGDVKASLRRDG